MSQPDKSGRLVVFEGPDGVGKTTLIDGFAKLRRSQGDQVVVAGFPGRTPGTLGHHIYRLHHDPDAFNIERLEPSSLQVLHVAAHIDTISRVIRPSVASGALVLLDRYWWSTWVYGIDAGADPDLLDAMIRCEDVYWGELSPTLIVLVERKDSLRPEDKGEAWHRKAGLYRELAHRESAHRQVCVIGNDGTVLEGVQAVADATEAAGIHPRGNYSDQLSVPGRTLAG